MHSLHSWCASPTLHHGWHLQSGAAFKGPMGKSACMRACVQDLNAWQVHELAPDSSHCAHPAALHCHLRRRTLVTAATDCYGSVNATHRLLQQHHSICGVHLACSELQHSAYLFRRNLLTWRGALQAALGDGRLPVTSARTSGGPSGKLSTNCGRDGPAHVSVAWRPSLLPQKMPRRKFGRSIGACGAQRPGQQHQTCGSQRRSFTPAAVESTVRSVLRWSFVAYSFHAHAIVVRRGQWPRTLH